MVEFDVQRQLGQFRRRLQRGEAQQREIFPDENPADKFFRKLLSPGVGVARSEFLATPGEL